MNRKMLIGNIIGILIIVGIISGTLFLVSQEKTKRKEYEENENRKQAAKMIEKVKDTKLFHYGDPVKQEDGTYKIKITNKETNQSQSYYLVDIKKKEYTLVATGHTGKEENVAEQKDS